MPVSSRRRTRRKLQEASDAEALDSSPSRPSVKKRKVSPVAPNSLFSLDIFSASVLGKLHHTEFE